MFQKIMLNILVRFYFHQIKNVFLQKVECAKLTCTNITCSIYL